MQFTAEHEALRASVRDLVEREINPHVDEWERAGRFPAHELFPVLAKIGLLGLEYDPAYGGEDVPVVVCIDTLNRSIAGSESKDEDMGAYIKAADRIRDAFDCVIVVVHHSPHDAPRPRGHSSLIGAADVQIAVIKDADDIVATLELAKDMDVGLRFVSRLDLVELGQDADGDPVTSCVVRAVEGGGEATKKPAGSRRSDDVAKVKRAIMDAYARLADAVDKTPGFDGKPVLKIPVDKLREQVKSRGFLETDDDGRLTSTGRKHFQRAKTDLIASKRFLEADGMFWRLYDIPQARHER